MNTISFKYEGETPAADTEVYELFSTLTAFGTAYAFPMHGIARIKLNLQHDQDCALNTYRSDDRGVTWHQLSTDSITGPVDESTEQEWLVEGFADWKLELVNGGAAQDPFAVLVTATTNRAPSS